MDELEQGDVGDIPENQTPPETPESDSTPEGDEQPSRMSVREAIADAVRKHSTPDDKSDKTQKPVKDAKPPKGAAAPGQQAGDKSSTPPQGAASATSTVPDAWKSKELQSVWNGLTPAVQAAIHKRETDMQNGVNQLKTRYQDLDGAVAPYRETIKKFGFTDAQAVDQLFKWQMALAGPQKIDAFVALLKSHGVDPATFANAVLGNRSAAPQAPQNGSSGLTPEVKQAIDSIQAKLGQYDQTFAAQQQSAAEQTVTSWAKDKPHFEKVKVLMGQLIQSGVVKPTQGDPFALDSAYAMAVHANAETRALIAAEEATKANGARKDRVNNARKAGSSMRSGAPVPPSGQQPGKQNNNSGESVRDSIRRAFDELRQ